MNLTRSMTGRLLGVFLALGCNGMPSIAHAGDTSVAELPELSISLRGVGAGTIEEGESFRVAVRVDAPGGAAAKLKLAPASGSWIDATIVELFTSDGKTVSARARPAPQTASQVTVVDEENPATALWWFPNANLQSVGPGNYIVTARLRIRDGTGWKGDVVSESAALRVVPESNDPERVVQRKFARAQAAIFAGELMKGAEILNAVLERDPDNVPALSLHAALSLHGGNRIAAKVCIDRALKLSIRPGEEPSAELHELAAQIKLAMADQTIAAKVPDWTRIPPSIFEPRQTNPSAVNIPESQASSAARSAKIPAKNTAAPKTPATAVVSPVVPVSATTTPAIPVTSAKSLGVVLPAADFTDAKVAAETAGQWAASAAAGSQYDKKQYSAAQATGAPNISVAGNSPDAWCPGKKNEGTEWLEVSFAKPVYATEARIRQNDAPGCIAKIEAIEPDGTAHVWWEGVDPSVAPATREIVWFGVRVPKTTYLVAKIRITLNLTAVAGWKEIDAVQLVGGN